MKCAILSGLLMVPQNKTSSWLKLYSAILQCSDEIISSLSDARRQQDDIDYATVFADSIDAAQTIALCAQHRKYLQTIVSCTR